VVELLEKFKRKKFKNCIRYFNKKTYEISKNILNFFLFTLQN